MRKGVLYWKGEKADSSGGRVGFSCSLRKLPLLSEILFLSHLSFPDTLIPFIMKQGVGADLDFAEKVFCSGPSLQRPYRFPGSAEVAQVSPPSGKTRES